MTRQRFAAAALACLLLATGTASGQSVAPEVRPSASPSPAPAPTEEGHPAAGASTSGGTPRVLWEGSDGSVALLNRVQFRFTHDMPDVDLRLPGTSGPGADRGSFRIRRAKTELTGWVWKRELTYELQLSWAGPEPGASTATPLEDFILNWDLTRDRALQVTIGQFKVPLGRQEMTSSNRLQFLDRDILSGDFTRGRDIGIQLWGVVARGKVEYRAGVFNGNPASRLDNDNDKYQLNARVMYQPWGDVKYSESDFESTDRPLLAIAAQFERNDLTNATNADDFDTRILGADVVFKYKGLFAFAEYFARHRRPETAPAFDSNGFHAQVGYFLRRHRCELAARYATFDPTDGIASNDRTEVGAVASYYIRRHALKIGADFRQIEDEGRDEKNRELRVQTQVIF
jgi:phosphate-selective porin OprO and OprP